jgi:hypothetical protein
MKNESDLLADAFYDEDYTFIEFVTKKRPNNQTEAEQIINNYLGVRWKNEKIC